MSRTATDHVGEAAHRVAMLLTGLDIAALGAASKALTRDDRRANLIRFFTVWPALCRAVSDLEAVAPESAAAGTLEAGKRRDVAERVR